MSHDPSDDVALHAVAAGLRFLTSGDAWRVARLVYLADWRAAITLGRQLTAHSWTVATQGPDVAGVEAILARLPSFMPISSAWLASGGETRHLSVDTRLVVEHVARECDPSALTRADLVRLCASTWPAMTDAGSDLDLPELARAYVAETGGPAT